MLEGVVYEAVYNGETHLIFYEDMTELGFCIWTPEAQEVAHCPSGLPREVYGRLVADILEQCQLALMA